MDRKPPAPPAEPPAVVSDVLVSDGTSVYMRFSKINVTDAGIEVEGKKTPEMLGGGKAATPHGSVLVSDDRMSRDGWFHRAGLMFGKLFISLQDGKLLCLEGK